MSSFTWGSRPSARPPGPPSLRPPGDPARPPGPPSLPPPGDHTRPGLPPSIRWGITPARASLPPSAGGSHPPGPPSLPPPGDHTRPSSRASLHRGDPSRPLGVSPPSVRRGITPVRAFPPSPSLLPWDETCQTVPAISYACLMDSTRRSVRAARGRFGKPDTVSVNQCRHPVLCEQSLKFPVFNHPTCVFFVDTQLLHMLSSLLRRSFVCVVLESEVPVKIT